MAPTDLVQQGNETAKGCMSTKRGPNASTPYMSWARHSSAPITFLDPYFVVVGWGWVMKGWGGVGWVGWVMKGWGGVGVGWVGHEGVGWGGVGWGGWFMKGWDGVGWGGSYRGGGGGGS